MKHGNKHLPAEKARDTTHFKRIRKPFRGILRYNPQSGVVTVLKCYAKGGVGSDCTVIPDGWRG